MRKNLSLMLVLMLALTTLCAAAEGEGLKKGDKRPEVLELQRWLNRQGCYSGEPDGKFGNGTETALKQYQEKNGLEQTGILDDETKQRLYVPFVYWVYRMECDWETANAIALDMGGHLVNIDSPDVAELLNERLGAQIDATFWIGARRFRGHTIDHSKYYWIGDHGLSALEPIPETPWEPNPWAPKEPSFRSSDPERRPEYAVRMRYDGDEGRWVWEDSAEPAQGFIVAFDDAQPEDAQSPQVNPADVRLESYPIKPAKGYNLEIIGLDGLSLITEVTAEEPCYLQFNFDNNGNRKRFYDSNFYEYIERNVKNRRVRVMLPRNKYEELPATFQIGGELIAIEKGVEVQKAKTTDPCKLYMDTGKPDIEALPIPEPWIPSRHVEPTPAPPPATTFIGHFVDESGAYAEALNAFYDSIEKEEGIEPPSEASFWFTGNWLSFVLDEDTSDAAYHEGDQFTVNDDSPRVYFQSESAAEITLPEGITPGVTVTVTGYVRNNHLTENNPWFDEWYAPWEQLIVIDHIDQNSENPPDVPPGVQMDLPEAPQNPSVNEPVDP